MTNAAPSTADKREMYAKMAMIRACDEVIRGELRRGRMTFFHFPVAGHEAIAAAMAQIARPDDYYSITYRGMHHQLARGLPFVGIIGEMAGVSTGIAGGIGGQMHVYDKELGLVVATGIVGGSTPPAVGLALAAKLSGTSRIAVCFLGDGATNTGSHHESMNLASVWNLPVVFVCENNQFAETTRTSHTYKGRLIERAAAYGMPAATVDGYDPDALFAAFYDAVGRARSGEGPTFIDATCFRYFGHFYGDSMVNVPKEELAAEQAKDPLITYRARLISEGALSASDADAIKQQAEESAKNDVAFTKNAPPANIDLMTKNTYAHPIVVR